MKLLHIDSSILGAASVSRALAADLVEKQRHLHPDLEVIYRDVTINPLQHLGGAHLAAAQSGEAPAELDFVASAAVLDEFLSADIIVVGAPMYNFAIPSQLKAWLDRLVVAGKTFRYSEAGPEGLVTGKKLFIVSSRGGSYLNPQTSFLDHQEAFLRNVFGFLGISDIHIIRAENVARPDLREKSIEAARTEIFSLQS